MPSERHIDLSERALRWVAARATRRGIRGGREMYVARNYVADALYVGSLQYRHYEQYAGVQDRITISNEVTVCGYWAFLFEVKVSRSDFLATFGPTHKAEHENRHNAVASLHWVVTPPKLLTLDDRCVLPKWWGLLEQSGQGLREIRQPALFEVEESILDHLHHEILWNGSARSGR